MLGKLSWLAVALVLLSAGGAAAHHAVGAEASEASAEVVGAYLAFGHRAPPGCDDQRAIALSAAVEHAADGAPDPCAASAASPHPQALAAAGDMAGLATPIPREAMASVHAGADDQVETFCVVREAALLAVLGSTWGECPPPTFGLVPVLLETSETGSIIVLGLGRDLGEQGVAYAETLRGFGVTLAAETGREASEGAIFVLDAIGGPTAPVECATCEELARKWALSCAEPAAPSEERCFGLYVAMVQAGVALQRAEDEAAALGGTTGISVPLPGLPEAPDAPDAPPLPEVPTPGIVPPLPPLPAL